MFDFGLVCAWSVNLPGFGNIGFIQFCDGRWGTVIKERLIWPIDYNFRCLQ